MSMKWTNEQDEQLREMYAADEPARVIGKRLGRTVAAVRARAYYLGISSSDRSRKLSRERMGSLNRMRGIAEHDSSGDDLGGYRRGWKARTEGRGKHVPGGLTPATRAWWLAGWHDKDMELGYRVSGVAA